MYEILRLRTESLIVEQECPYQDLDNLDQQSLHFMIFDKSALVGYTRLIDIGVSYPDFASIGRVVIKQSHRKKGIGKILMTHSIEQCKSLFKTDKIKISAQCYLRNFYRDLGFVEQGEEYLEDNIPHIAMVYQSK